MKDKPYTRGKQSYTIDDMNKLAYARGGVCCSTLYTNQKSKLLWQCKFGHTWWAIPASKMHLNSWCPVCARNQKLTIEKMHILAAEKGGKCLSDLYYNSKSLLLWECTSGHRWYASAFSIKIRNSWCPICYKVLNNKKSIR